jgi:hypothetical protein
VIGLGFILRCNGEVGAGIGTGGGREAVAALVVLVLVAFSSEALSGSLFLLLSAASFCFPCLFFPPIPAETSAKTLNGSPFSFLPCLDTDSDSLPIMTSLSLSLSSSS